MGMHELAASNRNRSQTQIDRVPGLIIGQGTDLWAYEPVSNFSDFHDI